MEKSNQSEMDTLISPVFSSVWDKVKPRQAMSADNTTWTSVSTGGPVAVGVAVKPVDSYSQTPLISKNISRRRRKPREVWQVSKVTQTLSYEVVEPETGVKRLWNNSNLYVTSSPKQQQLPTELDVSGGKLDMTVNNAVSAFSTTNSAAQINNLNQKYVLIPICPVQSGGKSTAKQTTYRRIDISCNDGMTFFRAPRIVPKPDTSSSSVQSSVMSTTNSTRNLLTKQKTKSSLKKESKRKRPKKIPNVPIPVLTTKSVLEEALAVRQLWELELDEPVVCYPRGLSELPTNPASVSSKLPTLSKLTSQPDLRMSSNELLMKELEGYNYDTRGDVNLCGGAMGHRDVMWSSQVTNMKSSINTRTPEFKNSVKCPDVTLTSFYDKCSGTKSTLKLNTDPFDSVNFISEEATPTRACINSGEVEVCNEAKLKKYGFIRKFGKLNSNRVKKQKQASQKISPKHVTVSGVEPNNCVKSVSGNNKTVSSVDTHDLEYIGDPDPVTLSLISLISQLDGTDEIESFNNDPIPHPPDGGRLGDSLVCDDTSDSVTLCPVTGLLFHQLPSDVANTLVQVDNVDIENLGVVTLCEVNGQFMLKTDGDIRSEAIEPITPDQGRDGDDGAVTLCEINGLFMQRTNSNIRKPTSEPIQTESELKSIWPELFDTDDNHLMCDGMETPGSGGITFNNCDSYVNNYLGSTSANSDKCTDVLVTTVSSSSNCIDDLATAAPSSSKCSDDNLYHHMGASLKDASTKQFIKDLLLRTNTNPLVATLASEPEDNNDTEPMSDITPTNLECYEDVTETTSHPVDSGESRVMFTVTSAGLVEHEDKTGTGDKFTVASASFEDQDDISEIEAMSTVPNKSLVDQVGVSEIEDILEKKDKDDVQMRQRMERPVVSYKKHSTTASNVSCTYIISNKSKKQLVSERLIQLDGSLDDDDEEMNPSSAPALVPSSPRYPKRNKPKYTGGINSTPAQAEFLSDGPTYLTRHQLQLLVHRSEQGNNESDQTQLSVTTYEPVFKVPEIVTLKKMRKRSESRSDSDHSRARSQSRSKVRRVSKNYDQSMKRYHAIRHIQQGYSNYMRKRKPSSESTSRQRTAGKLFPNGSTENGTPTTLQNTMESSVPFSMETSVSVKPSAIHFKKELISKYHSTSIKKRLLSRYFIERSNETGRGSYNADKDKLQWRERLEQRSQDGRAGTSSFLRAGSPYLWGSGHRDREHDIAGRDSGHWSGGRYSDHASSYHSMPGSHGTNDREYHRPESRNIQYVQRNYHDTGSQQSYHGHRGSHDRTLDDDSDDDEQRSRRVTSMRLSRRDLADPHGRAADVRNSDRHYREQSNDGGRKSTCVMVDECRLTYPHKLHMCGTFLDFHVHKRREMVNKYGLCPRCLQQHGGWCYQSYNCWRCESSGATRADHNSALCPESQAVGLDISRPSYHYVNPLEINTSSSEQGSGRGFEHISALGSSDHRHGSLRSDRSVVIPGDHNVQITVNNASAGRGTTHRVETASDYDMSHVADSRSRPVSARRRQETGWSSRDYTYNDKSHYGRDTRDQPGPSGGFRSSNYSDTRGSRNGTTSNRGEREKGEDRSSRSGDRSPSEPGTCRFSRDPRIRAMTLHSIKKAIAWREIECKIVDIESDICRGEVKVVRRLTQIKNELWNQDIDPDKRNQLLRRVYDNLKRVKEEQKNKMDKAAAKARVRKIANIGPNVDVSLTRTERVSRSQVRVSRQETEPVVSITKMMTSVDTTPSGYGPKVMSTTSGKIASSNSTSTLRVSSSSTGLTVTRASSTPGPSVAPGPNDADSQPRPGSMPPACGTPVGKASLVPVTVMSKIILAEARKKTKSSSAHNIENTLKVSVTPDLRNTTLQTRTSTESMPPPIATDKVLISTGPSPMSRFRRRAVVSTPTNVTLNLPEPCHVSRGYTTAATGVTTSKSATVTTDTNVGQLPGVAGPNTTLMPNQDKHGEALSIKGNLLNKDQGDTDQSNVLLPVTRSDVGSEHVSSLVTNVKPDGKVNFTNNRHEETMKFIRTRRDLLTVGATVNSENLIKIPTISNEFDQSLSNLLAHCRVESEEKKDSEREKGSKDNPKKRINRAEKVIEASEDGLRSALSSDTEDSDENDRSGLRPTAADTSASSGNRKQRTPKRISGLSGNYHELFYHQSDDQYYDVQYVLLRSGPAQFNMVPIPTSLTVERKAKNNAEVERAAEQNVDVKEDGDSTKNAENPMIITINEDMEESMDINEDIEETINID